MQPTCQRVLRPVSVKPSLPMLYMMWAPTRPGVSAVAFAGYGGSCWCLSVLCYGWLVTSAGLGPLGGQTEGAVEVISFLPRGWLCEGASWEE